MKQDEFEQLLQRADRAAHVPVATPQELADNARQSVRHQRRARTAYASCACLAALLIVVISAKTHWNSSGSGGPTPESQIIATGNRAATSLEDSPSPEELRRRISELSAEADRLNLIAKKLCSATAASHAVASKPSSQTSRKSRKPVTIPIRFVIEQEAEITARVMVEQAGRWLTNPERREEGIRTYHRTIDLFPTTTAAKTARFRLTQLENQSGATT